MIAKLLTKFLNLLLSLVMSVIQLICLPLNLLFDNIFPDFSEYISKINDGLSQAFSSLPWALDIIPPGVRTTLLFIFTLELSLLAILRSTHLTSKAWSILQKLKFW